MQEKLFMTKGKIIIKREAVESETKSGWRVEEKGDWLQTGWAQALNGHLNVNLIQHLVTKKEPKQLEQAPKSADR